MTPRIIMVSFGAEVLALTHEQFDDARRLARQIMPSGERAERQTDALQSSDRLYTAEEMSERTGLPATWFEEQARRGRIPHVRFGRYPRFEWEAAVASARFHARARPNCEADTRTVHPSVAPRSATGAASGADVSAMFPRRGNA